MAESCHKIPELLAPAGGPAALHAAISNGADAVYLGLADLNARRGAENFDLQGLEAACRYAHLRDRRVYLAANVVVLADEMERAVRLVSDAWIAGVDAVIVQDLGLLKVVHATMPEVRLHASTQLNAHNAPTVDALADLGMTRVTLARETSLHEIAQLAATGDAVGIEVESFVHGALCISYSGQCLLSSLIGGRSANRGLCAQPCRMAYSLVGQDGSDLAAGGDYPLSPRDLAGIGVLPQLVESGVAALKIEGRMKSPEYVALVTGVYRRALDRAVADPAAFEVRDGEWDVLGEAFSRGFSSAYLTGERGSPMMSYARPNNRGVMVGRVVAATPGRATVALERAVDPEDTLEFWTRRGRFAQRAGTLGGAGAGPSATAGAEVEVEVEQQVAVGDRVFRVANAQLLSAARRTFARGDVDPPVPVRFSVRVVMGEPVEVAVEDHLGRRGVASGDPVDRARTRAVTSTEVMEHVGRLGGTPYQAVAWDIDLSPGVGIGFSALHQVRRAALEAYERRILEGWSRRNPPRAVSARLESTPSRRRPSRVVASADDLAVALAALEGGADEAHVPIEALPSAGRVPVGVVPVVPRIARDEMVASYLEFARSCPAVVVGNLGLVGPAATAGSRVQAHWSLNVANPWSARTLDEMGAVEAWASPELSASQLSDLVARAPIPVGAAVYGRQEVMVTENCILAVEDECEHQCGSCARRQQGRVLRDRKGYEFPIRTDVHGRSHVFNSVPLDLSNVVAAVVQTGLSAVRLDFTFERAEEAKRITAQWRELVAGHHPAGSQTSVAARSEKRTDRTTGHFFRGVT